MWRVRVSRMVSAGKLVLMSRKGPADLIGALEGIDAEERNRCSRRKLPGTFDYNIRKAAGSNFAVERENHEIHATAW